jgi:N utilization substance protein B
VGSRRRSRECALQILFELDLAEGALEEVLRRFWLGRGATDGERDFAERLVRGVVAGREGIDDRIGEAADRWRLERMPAVDRNVLRIAIHELLEADDPPAVVIDEAIEVAKRFGGEGSGKFINGILDEIRLRLERERESGAAS